MFIIINILLVRIFCIIYIYRSDITGDAYSQIYIKFETTIYSNNGGNCGYR